MRRFIYLFLVLFFYSEFSFSRTNSYSAINMNAMSPMDGFWIAACGREGDWRSANSVNNCIAEYYRYSPSVPPSEFDRCYIPLTTCSSDPTPETPFDSSDACSKMPNGYVYYDSSANSCTNQAPLSNNICSSYAGTTFNYTISIAAGEDPSNFSPPSTVTNNGCKATFGGGDGAMVCLQDPEGGHNCHATATYTGEAAPSQENGDPAPDSGEECGVEGKPACPSSAPPLPYNCTSTNGVYTCVANPDYPGNTGGSEGGEGSNGVEGGTGGTGGSSGGTGGGDGQGGTGDGEGEGEGNGEGESEGEQGGTSVTGITKPTTKGNFDAANTEWDQKLEQSKEELQQKVDRFKTFFSSNGMSLSGSNASLFCSDSFTIMGQSGSICLSSYADALAPLASIVLFICALVALFVIFKD